MIRELPYIIERRRQDRTTFPAIACSRVLLIPKGPGLMEIKKVRLGGQSESERHFMCALLGISNMVSFKFPSGLLSSRVTFHVLHSDEKEMFKIERKVSGSGVTGPFCFFACLQMTLNPISSNSFFFLVDFLTSPCYIL